MADIVFSNPITGDQVKLTFSDLTTLIKGSSIKSLAIADDFFELGLSDAFNLRLIGKPELALISTLNEGEFPPVRLRLIPDEETPAAMAIEQRIHALRQVYAAAFLIDAGDTHRIADVIDADPKADLESSLLKKDDWLYLSAAGEGSLWITVLAKSKAALKSLLNIAPLFYHEGRQAILERLRATTELKKLDVAHKKMELAFKGANNLVDLFRKLDKIKDEHQKAIVQGVLSSNIRALGVQLPGSSAFQLHHSKPSSERRLDQVPQMMHQTVSSSELPVEDEGPPFFGPPRLSNVTSPKPYRIPKRSAKSSRKRRRSKQSRAR